MSFSPKAVHPTPEPWFVRELRKIDPELRVIWGYEQYLKNEWAIERRMSPERYFTAYASLLSSDLPRFVEQPIFDTNQTEVDPVTGEFVSYKQVGSRRYDLAPEWEWVMFTPHLQESVLGELRRAYAWERNHTITRMKWEKLQELEEKQRRAKARRMEVGMEGLDEAIHELRKKVVFGYGATRNE